MAGLRIKEPEFQQQPPSTPEASSDQEALLNSSFDFDGGVAYQEMLKQYQTSQ